MSAKYSTLIDKSDMAYSPIISLCALVILQFETVPKRIYGNRPF
jgi:hypothetical protein